jgi:hypothetical protein
MVAGTLLALTALAGVLATPLPEETGLIKRVCERKGILFSKFEWKS